MTKEMIFDVQLFADADVSLTATSSNEEITVGYSDNKITAVTANGVALNSSPAEGTIKVIDAGAGNDTIKVGNDDNEDNSSTNIKGLTILGGKGNDLINIGSQVGVGTQGNTYLYRSGDGNDTITGWKERDTLEVTGASYTTMMSADGESFIVKVGSSNIVLKGVSPSSKVKINGTVSGVAEASVSEITVPKIMSGTTKAEVIDNSFEWESRPTTSTDSEGNSTTTEGTPKHVAKSGTSATDFYLIDAAAGNDTIKNSGSNVSINAGAGNDKIIISSAATEYLKGDTVTSGVTITGGAGNDTINNSANKVGDNRGSNVYQYVANSDGKDVIIGYNGDEIRIYGITAENAESIAASLAKSDFDFTGQFVINIGSGSIALRVSDGAEADEIFDKSLNVKFYGPDNALITDDSTAELKQVLGKLPNTIAKRQRRGSSSDNIEAKFAGTTVDAGSGNDKITVTAGAQSIYGGAGNDVITLENGTNVKSSEHPTSYDDGVDASKIVTVTGGAGNDSINALSDADQVTFQIDSNSVAKSVRATHVYQFGTADGKDTIIGFNASDTIRIETSDSSLISADFDSSGNNFVIKAGTTTITLQKDPSDNNVTGFGPGSNINIEYIVMDGTDTTYQRLEAIKTMPKLVKGTSSANPLSNDKDDYIIDAAAGNDTVTNSGSNVSINAGAGNDVIRLSANTETITIAQGESDPLDTDETLADSTAYTVVKSYARNVTIDGGAGNDLIIGERGSVHTYKDTDDTVHQILVQDADEKNDVAAEGAGGRTFYFGSGDGNDTIMYFSTEDNIKLKDNTYFHSSAIVGNDFVLYFSKTDAAGATSTSSINLKNFARDHKGDDFQLITKGEDGSEDVETIEVPMELRGTTGNDLDIVADQDGYKVYALAGNDSVWVSGNEVLVDAGTGNDIVVAVGSSATIDAGAGNDKVSIGGDANEAYVVAGAGNDTILSNDAGGHTYEFTTNQGTNYILNFRSNDKIVAKGDGIVAETSVTNEGFVIQIGTTKVILKGELQKDSNGSYKDDNKLESYGVLEAETVIYITDSNGTQEHQIGKLIVGGASNDKIENIASESHDASDQTIRALAGNDTIYSGGANVLIEAGLGNDIIYLKEGSDANTIIGGAGNDIIISGGSQSGSANLYKYVPGDGNDTIFGWGPNDTLLVEGTEVSYASVTSAGFEVKIGSNKILIKGDLVDYTHPEKFASYADLNNEDIPFVNIVHTPANGTETLVSYPVEKLILGTAAANVIVNENLTEYKILAYGGNDTIINKINDVTIDAGAGNDVVSLTGAASDVIVKVGMGNDRVVVDDDASHVFEFSPGDGINTIQGIGQEDTIHLLDGAEIKSAEFVTTAGALKDYYCITLTDNITKIYLIGPKAAAGTDKVTLPSGATIGSGAGQYTAVIEEYQKTDDAEDTKTIEEYEGLSETDKANYKAVYKQEIINYSLRSDTEHTISVEEYDALNKTAVGSTNLYYDSDGNVTAADKSGDTDNYSEATVANLYYDADGSVTAEDKSSDSENYSEVTVANLYYDADGNVSYGVGLAQGDYTAHTETLYTFNGGNYTKLRETAFYLKVGDTDARGYEVPNEIYITNASAIVILHSDNNNDDATNKYNADNALIKGGDSNDSLNTGDAGNLNIQTGRGNDVVIIGTGDANTVQAGGGNDTIEFDGGTHGHLLKYAKGDGNDVVVGWGDDDSIEITGISSETEIEEIYSAEGYSLKIGSGKITFKGLGADDKINVTGPVNKTIVVPRRIEGTTGDDKGVTGSLVNRDTGEKEVDRYYITAGAGNDSIVNEGKQATIDAGSGNDTIVNGSIDDSEFGGNSTIIAEGGNDVIINTGSNVSINAGAGNDNVSIGGDASQNTIYAGDGNDTIYGNGKGNIYHYDSGDGNDVILNFSAGDTLQLNGTSVSDTVVTEEGFIFKLDNNKTILIRGERIITTDSLTGEEAPIEGNTIDKFNPVEGGIKLHVQTWDSVSATYVEEPYDVPKIKIIVNNTIPLTNDDASYEIRGTNEADVVKNAGESVIIETGLGKDLIVNKGAGVSINAGAGNDIIAFGSSYKNHSNQEITGDEYATDEAANSTVYAGLGNDTIYGNDSAHVYQYASGDGDDVIYNFSEQASIVLVGENPNYDDIKVYEVLSTTQPNPDYIAEEDFATLTSDEKQTYNQLVLGEAFGTLEEAEKEAYHTSASVPATIDNPEYKDVILKIGKGTITLKNVYIESKIKLGNGTKLDIPKQHKITADEASGYISNEDSYLIDGTNNSAGNTVTNNAQYVTVKATSSGANTITNLGGYSVITLGDGNDSVYNGADETSISLGKGKNIAANEGTNSTIIAGAGADSIQNNAGGVIINAGGDADTIVNGTEAGLGDGAVIDAGSGADIIYNNGSNVTINGGADNDVIYMQGSSTDGIVMGGAGNDTIFNQTEGGNIYYFKSGEGNDVISGFNSSSDRIQLALTADETYSVTRNSTDYTFNIYNSQSGSNTSKGTITLTNLVEDGQGGYKKTQIEGEVQVRVVDAEGNEIYSFETPKEITGTTGKDSDLEVIADRDGYVVEALGGDDVITNAGQNTTINAGDGKDTIYNAGNNAYIFGGADDDSIVMRGEVEVENTRQAQDSAGKYLFKLSGSNDAVTLPGVTAAATTLTYTAVMEEPAEEGGEATQKLADGKPVFKLNGEDAEVTLPGVESATASVTFNAVTETYTETTLQLVDPEGVTVNAGAGNDTIVAKSSHTNAIVYEYAEGDGNDVIYNYAEDDVLVISGNYNYTVKGDDFVINVGTGNTVGSITLKDVTNGKTVKIQDGNDPDGNITEIIVPKLINLVTVSGSGKTAYTYTSDPDDDKNAIINGTSGKDTITNNADNVLIYGFANDDVINLNDNDGVTVIAGAGNDTIRAVEGHKGVLYRFADGENNNLIENFGENDTIQITSGALATLVNKGAAADDPNNVILTIGRTVVSLKGYGVGDNILTIVDSGNTVHEITIPKLFLGDSTANELEAYEDNFEIRGLDGNDTLKNESYSDITMDGGNGNDVINNSGEHAVIYGGAANDTISNSGNNAEINGDAGADVIYNSGSNVLINDGADNDRIYLESGSSNATVVFGAGNDTVYNQDGTNRHVYKVSATSGSNTIIDFNKDSDTIQIADASIYSLDANGEIAYTDVELRENGEIVYTETGETQPVLVNGETVQATDEQGAGIVDENGNPVAETEVVRVPVMTQTTIAVSVIDNYTESNFVNGIFTISFGSGTKSSLAIRGVNAGDELHFIDKFGNEIQVKNAPVRVPAVTEGTTGADSIRVTQDNYVINTFNGNDTIENKSNNAVINAGAGTDSIVNGFTPAELADAEGATQKGNKVSINAGADGDMIINYGDDVTIYGGAANDTIYNYNTGSAGVKYQFGSSDGSNTIYGFNLAHDVLQFTRANASLGNASASLSADGKNITFIQGTTVVLHNENVWHLNDAINVSIGAANAANATINGYVSNQVSVKMLAGTNSAESFSNAVSSVSIRTGNGNDTVDNSGNAVNINLGTSGANSLSNSGSDVTVQSGSGSDTIHNGDATHTDVSKASINAGAGTDIIYNYGDNVTIYSGQGADTIYNHNAGDTGVKYQFIAEKATTTIVGFNADHDVLQFTRANSSIANTNVSISADKTKITFNQNTASVVLYNKDGWDTDVSINVSVGAVQIAADAEDEVKNFYNAPQHVTPTIVAGSENNDNLINDIGNITLQSGKGTDTIENSGANVYINAGSNQSTADRIKNTAQNVTIDAGKGADYIENSAQNVSINAGSEIDTIISTAGNVTIYSGAGNDSINTKASNRNGVVYEFGTNQGTNTIFGFDFEKDTIKFDNSTSTETAVSLSGDKLKLSLTNDRTTVVLYVGEHQETQFKMDGNDKIQAKDKAGNDLFYYLGEGGSTVTTTDATHTVEGTESPVDNNPLYETETVIVRDGDLFDFDASINISIGAAPNVTTNIAESDTAGWTATTTTGISTATLTVTAFVGTDGNDNLTITDNGKVFKALKGLDTITTQAHSLTVDLTANNGADRVTVETIETAATNANGVSILGGNTADIFTIERDYTYVKDNGGNNSIVLDSSNNLIITGAGQDTIWVNSGANDSINTGSAKDVIILTSEDDDDKGHTINAGDGNDSIVSNGKGNFFVTELSATRYNDTITGFGADDYLFFEGAASTDMTITETVTNGNTVLQFSSGTSNAYVYLTGKAEGAEIKYTIDTTALNNTAKTATYTIGGAAAAGRTFEAPIAFLNDLVDDDNFITNDAQISEITGVTQDNYSAGSIESLDFENLAQGGYVSSATYGTEKKQE